MNNNIINPNILKGHEGSLLQYIGGIRWETSCIIIKNSNNKKEKFCFAKKEEILKIGDIIVYVNSYEKKEENYFFDTKYEFIEFVNSKGKKIKLNLRPKNWMRYFIPYPEGGFIYKEPKNLY